MRRFFDYVYSVIAAVLNSVGITAPPAFGWTWTHRAEFPSANTAIADHFRAYMRHEGIQAGQFALRLNGTLVMSSGFTWADSSYPVTEPRSLMRIASCSKAFTTAAIMKLVDLNLISRDTHVFNFLGIETNGGSPRRARDPRVRDITVRHLMAHTGGWNYEDSPRVAADPVFGLIHVGRALDLDQPATQEQFATYVYDELELSYAPGERSKYSNLGFVLLGMVVAKASSKTYERFLQEDLLPQWGIDAFVGRTRETDRFSDEVLYGDRTLGPDATSNPKRPKLAPLPYGGFGAMTELMEAGGGLITTARSLSALASNQNILLEDMDNDPRGRTLHTRKGQMPGTSAIACSFDNSKDATKKYDFALIFNQGDKAGSSENTWFNSARFVNFRDTLRVRIEEQF